MPCHSPESCRIDPVNAQSTIRTAVATAGWLLLLISIAGSTLAQEGAKQATGDPAARVRISGIRTLRMKSRIVYRAAPDRPHLMEAAFAFPDRGYSRLVAETPDPSPARARFQLGSRVYAVNPPHPGSRALALMEADIAVRGLVLRRALMLWPRTVEWQQSGDEATVDLGSAGRLVARFDSESDLPISIASENLEGDEYERFTEIDWQTSADGAFLHPRSMKLEAGGAVIWDEVVVEYDPLANYIDRFFLPPDQRDKPRRDTTSITTPGGSGPQVEIHSIPPRTVRRFDLEGNTDWAARWEAALEIAARVETELGSEGFQLHPAMAFELDGANLPKTLLLRLGGGGSKDGSTATPTGWTTLALSDGASLFVTGASSAIHEPLAALRTAAKEADRVAGTPYMVLRRAPQPGRAQLVLPLHK